MINLNFYGGLTIAGYQVPTKLFHHSPPHQHREREEKIRWKKLKKKIEKIKAI